MRVAIAGAGAVGRSIAGELLENGHEVLLVDKAPTAISVERVPQAEWLLADACEITSLDEAALQRCNVVIAATGDDKVNLVVSLLAKTEYGVPRVVARVNNPKNEWLFNESWGVDVAVSTPRLMSALVEEAVSVGDLVRLLRFSHGDANLVELTLPEAVVREVDRPLLDELVFFADRVAGHRRGLRLADEEPAVVRLNEGAATAVLDGTALVDLLDVERVEQAQVARRTHVVVDLVHHRVERPGAVAVARDVVVTAATRQTHDEER